LRRREPTNISGPNRSFTVTLLAEIGSAIALGYAHYFADVMAATFLCAMMECTWERITAVNHQMGRP
jgi:hypothetical protein